ncbi:hypothetical protein IAR55_004586 [Kwoniella newhampshirensis]|uniref:Cupin 2 conserved barrel domain-containing protein n=1 Tax=Kwoniella newhampshirensis TaxID=1651941 RepID=A0AAW0YY50_9TREE
MSSTATTTTVTAKTLPPPHRILASHSTIDGTPLVMDDTFPHANDDETLKACVGYVQPTLIGEPEKAVEWAGYRPSKISHDDQTSLRWVDIPPHYEGALHFTNTFGKSCDYLIVTHGEAVMGLHDGTTKTVRVGDAVVQIANIHSWSNHTSEWARFVGVVVPSKPVLLDGEGLDRPPFNGYHAQF